MRYPEDFQKDDLIISIRYLIEWIDSKIHINEPHDCIDYYSKTLSALKQFATVTNDTFIQKCLNQIPEINGIEISEIINDRNGTNRGSIASSDQGSIFEIIVLLLSYIGINILNKQKRLEIKLHENRRYLERILNVLENPAMVELYNEVEK